MPLSQPQPLADSRQRGAGRRHLVIAGACTVITARCCGAPRGYQKDIEHCMQLFAVCRTRSFSCMSLLYGVFISLVRRGRKWRQGHAPGATARLLCLCLHDASSRGHSWPEAVNNRRLLLLVPWHCLAQRRCALLQHQAGARRTKQPRPARKNINTNLAEASTEWLPLA